MPRSPLRLSILLAACTAFLFGLRPTDAAPPEGFTRTSIPGDWEEIVGIVPVGDGRFVAWERAGLPFTVMLYHYPEGANRPAIRVFLESSKYIGDVKATCRLFAQTNQDLAASDYPAVSDWGHWRMVFAGEDDYPESCYFGHLAFDGETLKWARSKLQEIRDSLGARIRDFAAERRPGAAASTDT